jgi:hypothetical protein
VAEMSVFCFLGLSILEDLTAYNFFFIFMAIVRIGSFPLCCY